MKKFTQKLNKFVYFIYIEKRKHRMDGCVKGKFNKE